MTKTNNKKGDKKMKQRMTIMIKTNQLVKGANFWWSEFLEKIIITKSTPKMVWYFAKHDDNYKPERRISKENMLDLLNGCNFIEI